MIYDVVEEKMNQCDKGGDNKILQKIKSLQDVILMLGKFWYVLSLINYNVSLKNHW